MWWKWGFGGSRIWSGEIGVEKLVVGFDFRGQGILWDRIFGCIFWGLCCLLFRSSQLSILQLRYL